MRNYMIGLVSLFVLISSAGAVNSIQGSFAILKTSEEIQFSSPSGWVNRPRVSDWVNRPRLG